MADFSPSWPIGPVSTRSPLYFVMMGLLLAGMCAGWWTLRRITGSRGESTVPEPVPVWLRIAIGFAIIVVGARVFAELAEQLGAGEVMGQADLALSEALTSSLSRPALKVFAVVTHLGDPSFVTVLCIAVAIALLALGRRRLAVGWVVAVAGNGVLSLVLKEIFARIRPLHVDGFGVARGFSFPSGHSSGSVVVYGMLARHTRCLLETGVATHGADRLASKLDSSDRHGRGRRVQVAQAATGSAIW